MSVIGVVEDGKVVLPPEMQLPTGTRVRVELLPPAEQGPSLAETFKDYIGIFDDLPQTWRATTITICTAHRRNEHRLRGHVLSVSMQELGLTEAAAGDRHFEQAGFKALLL